MNVTNKQRIDLLRQRIDEEQWKIDHNEAQRLAKLEDGISYFCWLFERAVSVDAQMHEAAFGGEYDNAEPEFNEYCVQMRGLFATLAEKWEIAEQEIQQFEAMGYVVDRPAKYQNCYEQLKSLLRERGPVDGNLSQLRDEAINQHRAGKTEDLDESGEKE